MNKKEFGEFYDKNIDNIFRFVYFRVDSTETAQDITAMTFLKFWQKMSSLSDKYHGKENDPIINHRAFLYQIAHNQIIDFYRRKNKKPLSLEKLQDIADFQVAHTTFQQKVELNWQMQETKQALQKLPPLYAEIIIWRYLDNLSYKEIAEILKKKEGTVRVLLHRGMKALKSQLEDTEKPKEEY